MGEFSFCCRTHWYPHLWVNVGELNLRADLPWISTLAMFQMPLTISRELVSSDAEAFRKVQQA